MLQELLVILKNDSNCIFSLVPILAHGIVIYAIKATAW